MTSPAQHRKKTEHQKAELWGRLAEHWVSLLLWMQFYRRLHHRHRNRFGEIDLIFYRGRQLLFVEVKLRGSLTAAQKTYDAVEHAMPPPHQKKRLLKAAEHFWHTHPEHTHKSPRFDLVIVHKYGWCWWFKGGLGHDETRP